MRRIIGLLLAASLAACPTLRVAADTVQTIDLSRFVGHSPVVTMDATWLVPHGRQVIDGIPFQMDGSLLMLGKNSLQKQTPGWTNVNDIFVGRKFERLHLLGGVDFSGPDGIAVARVRLLYADGSDAVLELKYGEQLRCWLAAWHKEEAPLQGTNSRVVWTGQNSSAAQSDKYLRLFHITLANPSPEKEVRTMALESAGTQYGLLLLAASSGPAVAESLPDTVSKAKNPFPDLRPRTGELVQGEGFLKSIDGKPIAGGMVRIMASRELNQPDGQSSTQANGAGTGTETDANGHFVLPPLPDNRLYRLLVTGKGFESKFYRGLDPKSDPVEIRLKPLGGKDGQALYSLRARVVGPDGNPLAYAMVETDGVGNGGGTRWGGGPQGFASPVLADTNGELTLARAEPFDRLQLIVTAPGLAPNKLWISVTNVTQTIQMGVGASVRGRLLLHEKPLAGVRVGVSGHDRNSEVYARNFEAKTGTNGEFAFEHLPPDTAWYFYGIMDSLKSYGAVPPRLAHTSGHGQVTDLGDLNVAPGLRLAGLVKTRHGEPPPKDLSISVGYDGAWDRQTATVDKEGRFRFEGLAGGKIQVSVYERNWHLTGANRSLDNLNPWYLTGQLEQDKDDLWLMIDKGGRQFNYSGTSNGRLPPQDQPDARPISGVEPSGLPLITLAGTVLDDDTGKPILKFQVSPGYKPPVASNMPQPKKPFLDQLLNSGSRKMVPWNERIYWMNEQKETISNGNFSVDFVPLSSEPVLQIEAAGYEPLQSDPTNRTVTNLVLRLKKGVGPGGVVLLPNGQPAPGATVVYGVAQEQFSLGGTSLSSFGRTNALLTTASDGKFSFAPRPEGITLFVSHPSGWAVKSLGRGSVDNLKIYLEPWCTVSGTLVDSNNVPAPAMALKLTMFRDWQRGGALVNLQHDATTDAQGNFIFTKVPPGRLELQRMVPFKVPGGGPRGGMTYQMQLPFTARPGINNDLGKVILDHPPAESMVDAIKTKLGL